MNISYLTPVTEFRGFVKPYRIDYAKDPEDDLLYVQHLVPGVDDLQKSASASVTVGSEGDCGGGFGVSMGFASIA